MADNGTWQTQNLLAPGIELPRADPVFARDLGWRQLRPQALANDLALLLNGPGPTPINRAEDLPRGDASARKTNLTSVLSRENQVRRQSIHIKIGSQNAYAPPDGVVATLTILGDRGGELANAFGIRWKSPEALQAIYKQLGADLTVFNGEPSWTLPMPARYVIGRDGTIVYSEVNPDYTHRPEPNDLLPILRKLATIPVN
jgi:hypothetical protein